MKNLRTPSLLLLALMIGQLSFPSNNFAEPGLREKVQAAFIYKFLSFMKWPEYDGGGEITRVHIGVLGDGVMKEALKQLDGKRAGNYEVIFNQDTTSANMESCQILFFSESVKGETGGLIKQLEGKPVLTVADWEGFQLLGGIVTFYLSPNGKVRFYIEYESSKKTGINISSKLLNLGKSFH